MFAVRYRKLSFIVTGCLLLGSVLALLIIPPQLSIEFTGGSLMQVAYEGERPSRDVVHERINSLGLGEPSVRESDDNSITIRTRTLEEGERALLLSALSADGADPLTELRFNSIGPSLGSELAIKALYAIAGVIVAIVLYIAWAFRQVSRPVSSWVYGLVVAGLLIHDVLIAAGFYAVFAFFTGAQIDTLFVVAILAILGYSVNDTIVICDRVRERLGINSAREDEGEEEEPFEDVVGVSVQETLGRSINTSVTTGLALLALVIFGGAVTFNFALLLLVGVFVGAYSSILVAAPMLIPLAKKFARPVKPETETA